MPVKYIRRSDSTPGVPPQDNIVIIAADIAGAQTDRNVFIADRDYEIVKVSEVHSVAGAGSSTLDVKKCTGTTAVASGTTVLSSTFALDSTVETIVNKTAASGLTATRANRRITTGDRLSLDFSGTVTAWVGMVQIHLRPINSANDLVGF